MPAGDMTGPQGFGPLTGRRFGPCGRGRSAGIKMRCKRGLGGYFGWNTPMTKEEQIKDFESYKKALGEELEDVDKALISLKKPD